MPWQSAGEYIGWKACVCGEVLYTTDYDDTFYIHFSRSSQSFYGYSHEYYWEDLEGYCIDICGKIEEKYGRLRILIEDPERQVFPCP